MKYRNSIGAAMVATLLVSASAMADDSKAGWYVGANVGQSDAHVDKEQLDDIWARQGANASTSFDDKDLAYSLNGGYRFNKFFALEGSYIDFGRFDYRSRVSSPASDTVTGHYAADGWTLAGVGILPLEHGFSLYGKAGLIDSNVKLSAHSQEGNVSLQGDSHRDINPMLGLGVGYDLTRNVEGTLEWNRFINVGSTDGTARADLNLVAVGLHYNFN